MVLPGMLHQSLGVECLKKEENKLPKIYTIRTGHDNMSIIKQAINIMRSYYEVQNRKLLCSFMVGNRKALLK